MTKSAYEHFAYTPCTLDKSVIEADLHDDRGGSSLHSTSTYAYYHDSPSCDSLTCDERLLATPGLEGAGSPCMRMAHMEDSPLQLGLVRSNSAPPSLAECSSAAYREHVARMIGNEAQRQWEVQPCSRYLEERHPALEERHRAITVGWLVEVTAACSLRQTSLVLAVSYLDRFLSVAKDISACMLQLIAVACLSLAAKQEELLQPSPAEWVAIAGGAFTLDDLTRMEWMVFHHLSWRGRTPTASVFLSLFCCGLDLPGSGEVAKVAAHLVGLSISDFSLLQFDYSTVAAAALVAAHQTLGLTPNADGLLALAPFLNASELSACSSAVWALHLAHQQSARV